MASLRNRRGKFDFRWWPGVTSIRIWVLGLEGAFFEAVRVALTVTMQGKNMTHLRQLPVSEEVMGGVRSSCLVVQTQVNNTVFCAENVGVCESSPGSLTQNWRFSWCLTTYFSSTGHRAAAGRRRGLEFGGAS